MFVTGLSGVESATAPDPVLGAFCGADTSGVDCDGAFAVVPAPPTDDPVFALLPPVAPPKLFAPSWNPFSELLLPKKPFVNFAPPSVCGFSHFPVSGFFWYPSFITGFGASGVLPSPTSTSTFLGVSTTGTSFLGTSVSATFCFGVSTSTTFASVGGGTVSATCFLGGSTTCPLSTFGVSTTCFLLSTGSGLFLIGV